MQHRSKQSLRPVGVTALLWLLTTGLVSASPFTELGHRKALDRPAVVAPADVLLALPEAEARRRIDAAMTAEGFGPSDAAKSPSQLGYVRFGDLEAFRTVADCSGVSVGNPKIWIETLIIDLHPDGGGVRIDTTGQFKVVLSGLISGAPFTKACKSRGVLEARIRDAISKG